MTGYAGLEGPYPLSYEGISEALPVKTAGVFALGYVGRDNAFYINYIGRSDEHLRECLLGHIGSDKAFKYGIARSAQEAFWRECELFHRFRPNANRVHPGRLPSTSWVCPRCRVLEHGS
jgi:hypothetical protein